LGEGLDVRTDFVDLGRDLQKTFDAPKKLKSDLQQKCQLLRLMTRKLV
jgi:hypothetical protein